MSKVATFETAVLDGQMSIIAEPVTTNKLVQTSGQNNVLTIDSDSYDIITDEDGAELITEIVKGTSLNSVRREIKKDNLKFTFVKSSYAGDIMISVYTNSDSRHINTRYCRSDIINFREGINKLLSSVFEFLDEYRQQYTKRYEQCVDENLTDVKQSYLKLGYIFKQMRSKGLFPGGQKYGQNPTDFYDYTEKRFGFKKSSVCNMINIVEKLCVGGGSDTHELKPMFVGYSYSQLSEILSLPAIKSGQIVRRDELPPVTATVQEIREMKKPKAVQTSGQEKSAAAGQQKESKPAHKPLETIEADVGTAGDKLTFKNNDEREKWLKDYRKHCYLWVDVPPLKLKVYRYDFVNSVSLIACEMGLGNSAQYELISDVNKAYPIKKNFDFHTLTDNQVVDWLRDNRTEI